MTISTREIMRFGKNVAAPFCHSPVIDMAPNGPSFYNEHHAAVPLRQEIAMRPTWLVVALLLSFAPLFAGEPAGLKKVILSTDRTVDFSSEKSILRDVWEEGFTPQQKALALWRCIIQRNCHKQISPMEDRGNMAELMTKYGYCMCGNWAYHSSRLFAAGDMESGRVGLKGHWVTWVKYWEGLHSLDFDMWAVYSKANGMICSPGEMRRLKENGMVMRETPSEKSYPWYIGADSIKGMASCYGRASPAKATGKATPKWRGGINLRPGMEINFSYYPDPDIGFVSISHCPNYGIKGHKPFTSLKEYLESDYNYYAIGLGGGGVSPKKEKWTWGYRRGGLTSAPLGAWPGVGGNGRVTFDLGKDGFKNALAMADDVTNLEVKDGKLALADAAKPGSLVLNFAHAYPFADGFIAKPLPEKGVKVEVSVGNKAPRWQACYPTGGQDDGKRIRLFPFFASKKMGKLPKRGSPYFKLKLTLEANAQPLESFRAVGVFHHCFTVLPALVKGKNKVRIALDNADALDATPLVVTYVYDQLGDDRKIYRHEHPLLFSKDKLELEADTGEKHWPMPREIRYSVAEKGAKAPEPKKAPIESDLDYGAAPWYWCFYGVNYWNDFERGDLQGMRGTLITKNTYNGSDFSLDNSLMSRDGTRQLKFIRQGSVLARGTKFRAEIFVKNVKELVFLTRDQADRKYYRKVTTGLKDGEWQTFKLAYKDLEHPDDATKKLPENHFCYSTYLYVRPAEGKEKKDVVFLIDNVINYDTAIEGPDGELKFDPFKDPEAWKKARAADPVWNAKPAK